MLPLGAPTGTQLIGRVRHAGTRRVYPPIHSQLAYRAHNHLRFPVTEQWSARGLWLPSSTRLTDAEIARVCETICAFYLPASTSTSAATVLASGGSGSGSSSNAGSGDVSRGSGAVIGRLARL